MPRAARPALPSKRDPWRRMARSSATIAAMASIEQASPKISDINSVIDDIAFRLPTCAPARRSRRHAPASGELAVMASEVRTLALAKRPRTSPP